MTTDEPVGALKRLFFGVATSDGEAVWEELSSTARAYVLNVAVQQGMDFELGSRLRRETASDAEFAAYLENLAWGLARDLDGIELSHLDYEADPEADGRVRVRYLVPLDLAITPRGGEGPASRPRAAAIPAGSAILVAEDGRWRVERLVPRPGP